MGIGIFQAGDTCIAWRDEIIHLFDVIDGRASMVMDAFIRQQPAIIAGAIATAQAFAAQAGSFPHVLAGSGSSFNALVATVGAIPPAERAAMRVIGPEPLLTELHAGGRMPKSLLVLSQSGASATSVALAREAAAAGAELTVVTCERTSAIAALGLPTVLLSIDGEPIGPKTKGFTATLAACLALSRGRASSLPEFSAETFAAFVEWAERAAAELASHLSELNYLMVAGSGRMTGIALEASLKVTEIAGLPTSGFETEELLHGRLHGADRRSLVVMLAGDDGERDTAAAVARVMAERRVRAVIVNATSKPTPYDWITLDGIPTPWDTLGAIVPFQWLAWHLARAAGMEPEAMRYPGLSGALAIKLQMPAP